MTTMKNLAFKLTNNKSGNIPGVPFCDLSIIAFEALPTHLQNSVAASEAYTIDSNYNFEPIVALNKGAEESEDK